MVKVMKISELKYRISDFILEEVEMHLIYNSLFHVKFRSLYLWHHIFR